MAWILSPYWSILVLPFTVSPTLAMHAGDGRHRFDAAASVNSLLESLVSWPGQANSHAEETLSLCFHAQAALVLLGLT